MPFTTTITGLITSIAAVITALALLGGVMPALMKARRETRELKKQVGEVHVIVNQQRTDAQNYQRALIDALTRAGIDVPADQSLPALPVTDTERGKS
jgi:hypothetical protein